MQLYVAENECGKACNALVNLPPFEPTLSVLEKLKLLHPGREPLLPEGASIVVPSDFTL